MEPTQLYESVNVPPNRPPEYGARSTSIESDPSIVIHPQEDAPSGDRHYHPTLITGGTEAAPTYEVTVSEGWVSEQVPGADDGLDYHEADNHWDAVDPTKLRKHAITVAQAIYVDVKILATGQIGGDAPAVTIAIAADEESSTHYTPKVNDLNTAGAAGVMRYKLAVLKAGPGAAPPKIKEFLAGGDINYVPELPALLSTALPADGIGCIPMEWSDSLEAYRLRAISKGLGKLNVDTEGDLIEIRGTKKDADIKVYYGDTPESEALIAFQDGLSQTGAEVIGNEDPIIPPEDLVIQIPAVIADDAGGLAVAEVAGAVKGISQYKIRGNSKDGTLAHKPEGGSEVPVLAWLDGLITSEGAKVIPSLPAGAVGEMLYHDGTDWVILANPGAPATGTQWVIHHNGTLPRYEAYLEKEIDICDSGTPTAYTILAKLVV